MRADVIFERTTRAFAFLCVVIVCLMGALLLMESWPSIQQSGLLFLIKKVWDPVIHDYGALPFVYGTLVSSGLALVMAIPLSLGIAIFLSELAPYYLRRPIAFLVELLAAIPSVIYGLWGLFYLVPLLREKVEPFFIDRFGFLPFFEGPPYGIGMLPAAILLAIMIIPIISSISRDVMQAVPQHQREAALALGATRWETTRVAVLRYGKSGIFGAIFLGLGRALGETMAVTMVIGNRPDISLSLFAPSHTMASVIANEFAEASSDMYVSALAEIGLVLFLVTFLVNMMARLLVMKTAKPFAT